METGKKKTDEKSEQLKQELQELQVGFVVQKEESNAEYHKQVDDMFFYGYRCYMKKHGIVQDTPTFPSNDEDETIGGHTRGKEYASRAGPSRGHI